MSCVDYFVRERLREPCLLVLVDVKVQFPMHLSLSIKHQQVKLRPLVPSGLFVAPQLNVLPHAESLEANFTLLLMLGLDARNPKDALWLVCA